MVNENILILGQPLKIDENLCFYFENLHKIEFFELPLILFKIIIVKTI